MYESEYRKLVAERKAKEQARQRANVARWRMAFMFVGFFCYPVILMAAMRIGNEVWPSFPAWGYWRCLVVLCMARLAIWGIARSWAAGKKAT